MQSICTDVCTEVSGDFNPNFHYINQTLYSAIHSLETTDT